MQSFHSLHAQHDDASQVIEHCSRLLASSPSEYNFGFLYVTDAMSAQFEQLLYTCKQATGIEHWLGTVGIGIISDNAEHYDTPAASIMLAQFDTADVRMLPALGTESDVDVLESPYQTHFAIVHGDPHNPQTQAIIQQLSTRLHNAFLVGGLTSSRDQQLQLADQLSSNCVNGALFSENVAVATNLSQGCSPIGDKHSITRANDNVLFELDGRASLDVIMADTGADDIDALREQADNLFVGLCITDSDRSDYTVRNLVAIDIEHKVFAINDHLSEGGELIFCRRDRDSAERDMRDMLRKLAKRIDGTPRGGLYVSCLGRGREQFGDDSEEIRMIHEELGEFPLTGFFANGEIHHDKLYGYTGVLTLFL